MTNTIGSWLIVAGTLLVIAGLFFKGGYLDWLGRLPGDIAIKTENVQFFFPLTTMILLSATFSTLVWLLRKLF